MRAGLATDRYKRSLDDYVEAATALFEAMARDGFDARFPIPVDPDGELLNGAHRVACALAMDIKTVPVHTESRYVWAPAWGAAWFRANGMDGDRLAALIDFQMEMAKLPKG